MTAFQQQNRRNLWRTVGITSGLVVVLFTVIFVPTYVIKQKQRQGNRDALVGNNTCTGFRLPDKEQQPPKYPATKKRPNFIYILVDDQGYDDIRMHHPAGGMHKFITTPNMDALVRQSMEFTNFYTTPMCSTSRAELLTGRYYPRTGAMYINTGWDFINPNETNIAEIMAAAGYKTSAFGKWHNGRTAGYQPYDLGFQDSFLPTPYVHLDNLMYINGNPKQTKGWMEDVLMGYAVDYLKDREKDGKPFFLYYPAFSVHAGWLTAARAADGGRYQRPAPPKYMDKYRSLPLSDDTADLYAMLEHFDDQIGRLRKYIDSSSLAGNTYIMLSGDNGPALFSNEAKPLPRVVRMPSGMQGAKHNVREGGIRNYLAVRGPGVPQGSSSYALLGLIDVLPTVVDLAGITQVAKHLDWDGISFANLLAGQPQTQQQQERMLFSMETSCIEEDFVPKLGPDRRTLKPQDLLSYTEGGVSGLGFKRCVGVRYKHYKWLADARKTQGKGPKYSAGGEQVPTALYKFKNGLHIELPCQEVSKQEPAVAAKLEQAAEKWFTEMLDSEHSFEKPLFFLGLGGRPGVNIVADGAVERTLARVQVLPMGLAGFVRPGDSASYRIRIAVPGIYKASLYYQSSHNATFRLWIGPYRKIQDKTAMYKDVQLPAGPQKRGNFVVGNFTLPQTKPGEVWEVKLELTRNGAHMQPVIKALDTLFFRRVGAPGHIVHYDPDGQEGVKAWKIAHGYKNIVGGH